MKNNFIILYFHGSQFYVSFLSRVDELSKLACLPLYGSSSLRWYSTAVRTQRPRLQIPLKPQNLFSQLLKLRYNCDGHIIISFVFLQFTIHFILNFIISNSTILLFCSTLVQSLTSWLPYHLTPESTLMCSVRLLCCPVKRGAQVSTSYIYLVHDVNIYANTVNDLINAHSQINNP